MAVTHEQLASFHEFAVAKLNNGGIESLDRCLREWYAEIDRRETIAAVRRGEEDFAAGRYMTLKASSAEIRRRLQELR